MATILQTNANNSRLGSDTLMQVVKELQAGIVVVAEPHFNKNENPCWFYSSEKRPTVGIFWNKIKDIFAPVQIKNGNGYVCVKWNVYIVGCYFSPNRLIGEFARYLDSLQDVIDGIKNSPIIMMGDFNARHNSWDSRNSSAFLDRNFLTGL
jgi:hypothetical protein